jgi:hypothetical protein
MACVHVNKLYGDSNERCRCALNAYVEIIAQALSYCTSVRTQSGTILLHLDRAQQRVITSVQTTPAVFDGGFVSVTS